MTNRQLKDMMRDIAPRYQQEADARAESAAPAKKNEWLPAAIGAAAVCCTGIAAVVMLPHLHNDLIPADSAVQDIREVSEAPESLESSETDSGIEHAGSIVFDDLTNGIMRIVAPAYAPCAYTPTAEEQREIAKAFMESEWVPASDTQIPDGESVSLYIYDPQAPMVLTFYMNRLVRVSTDGFSANGVLYEPPQNAWKAVRRASMHDGESLLKRLTWCGMESLSTPKFWDNFSINPRECDMMTQDGLFFKMSNSVDYFGRVSGRVLFGDSVDAGSAYSYAVQVSDFQYNLDMGTCYEDMTYYLGNSLEDMAESRFDRLQREGHTIYAADGTMIWQTADDTEYKVTMGGSHRCEFGVPIENNQRHKIEDGMDFWYFRRGVSYGYTARECLFPENLSLGCLYDFDSWKIAGTAELGGRTCTVVKGSLTGTYSKKLDAVTFEMYVDQETGILMQYKGYDANGRLGGFLITENLKFGDNADLVQSFDPTGLKKADGSLSDELIEQINTAEGSTINPNDTAAKQTTAAGSSKSGTSQKTSVTGTTTTTAVTTTANQNAKT
ncbi:MAG: hypothetical protein J6Z40_14035, partial [Oscillospiraceae bacterium]|nr:hypothetical protein [Oscillospiraceae bacterium]